MDAFTSGSYASKLPVCHTCSPLSPGRPPVHTRTNIPSIDQARAASLGDGFSRAFELAFTPVIFCGFGYVIDRTFSTLPVFMITLTVLAVVGMFYRLWYRYAAEIAVEQARTMALKTLADETEQARVRAGHADIDPEITATDWAMSTGIVVPRTTATQADATASEVHR